jgi:arylsulfatase A-like enzyme/dienelactone hydrolase
LFVPVGFAPAAEPNAKPNIVVILADDLGYGDVQRLNPNRGKIKTPHLDKLASQGMTFTDAHSGSSVCTPTRYGLLTGRYAWRTRLQRGVLDGYVEPLIAKDRLTLPSLLQGQGYHTACVGKWHLGFTIAEGGKDKGKKEKIDGAAVGSITRDGPTTRGFDHFFGFHHARMMKSVFENDRVTRLVEPVDMLPLLAQQASSYVSDRAKTGKPFFLYLPLNSPHTPIVPSKDWKGRSGLGDYGDFVMETDWAIGEVLAAIEKAGVADNTLVLLTSDNGCSPAAGTATLEKQGHFASAGFRGYKADIWDGGHRVPFLVRWPGTVKADSRSDRLVCLTDLFATFAEVVGAKVPASSGEDSVSFLPDLLGKPGKARDAVVHHSIEGRFAIRDGRWKLCLCGGSGGWSKGETEAPQLYDLVADPGETRNRAADEPEVVTRLTKLLESYVADGRSTPGEKQKNDVAVQILKKAKAEPPKKDAPPDLKKVTPAPPTHVVYKEASGDKLQLHIYAPADAKPGDNRTAIVFFFGGGWSAWNPTQFEPFARYFADLGCVAICADYRVSSRHKTTPTDAVRDAKSAVRYVREHAKEWGADPTRIGVAGGSAGGHLAACTALVPGFLDEKDAKDSDAAPNALILFNPVLDTSAAGFGGAKRGDELKPISPQHHVREKSPPVLVLHGTADTTVPFKQVEAFAKAMEDAGNVCEVEAFEGRGHGFFNHPDFRKGAKPDDYEACVKRATKFLEEQKFLPARVPQK